MCLLSEIQKESRRISNEIDREIRINRKNKRDQKLLILGTGESGKSTFIKQMRIIHGSGYTSDEKKAFIKFVINDIYLAITTIIDAMFVLEIEFSSKKALAYAKKILQVDYRNFNYLEASHMNAINFVWNDSGLQKCFERRREYQLIESAKYYLDDLVRIAQEDYLPTEQDILRVRIPTTGVHEYLFILQNINFKMIDVGGQRSERRKWIHCFEGVTSIMFLVALSEYDQFLAESTSANRLEESRALFSTIMRYPWFKSSSVILFLNKNDVIEEKIKKSHLQDFFPEFNGPKQDAEAAREFIRDIFIEQNTQEMDIYSHYTCATDTQNIKVVFNAVKDTILQKYMKEASIM